MRIVSALLVACLAGATAWASIDAPGDLVDQAKGATRVVVATVTDVASSFAVNEFGDQLIVSQVTFRVEARACRGGAAGATVADARDG